MFTYSPKLIELVILHTKNAMLSLLLVSLVFVYTYMNYIPYKWLALWILAQIIFLSFRIYNAKQLQKAITNKNLQELKRQTIYYCIAVMLSTVIWTSSSILSYIFAPPVYQFISLLMIVGVVTASILSISSLYKIFIFYFLCMLLPQFAIMIFTATHESFSVAIFVLIYIPLILMLSTTMQESYNIDITSNQILQENADKLHKLAITDSLTKVYNRRYFFETAQSLIFVAKRERQEVSLLMIDIDFFKDINDTYGHYFGDTVLVFLAKSIHSTSRESDLFARIGGEEFTLLLNNTSHEGAKIIAEKIRKTIEEKTLQHQGREIKLTISLGVSTLNNKNYNIEKLYQEADTNLYLAKKNGRNKVY